MPTPERLHGVVPAIPTPFTADGREVDEADPGELLGPEVEALRRVMALALGAGAERAHNVEPVAARVPVAPDDLEDRLAVGQLERFGEGFGGSRWLCHVIHPSTHKFARGSVTI